MNLIIDLLFPKRCVGCGEFGTYFCKECISNIKQKDLICPQCKRSAVGGQTHPICQRKYALDGLWSLGIYQGSLQNAIKQLKYRFVQDLAKTLVDIVIVYWARYQPFLLEKIKKDQGQNWIVVPVPLHIYRKNWRGFNQTALLAQDLANRLGIKYMDVLKRVTYTKPQSSLHKEDRIKNIKNTFEVLSDCKLSPETCVLIVDDIWTTGATLKECCYKLKKAGAKQVWALTLAR